MLISKFDTFSLDINDYRCHCVNQGMGVFKRTWQRQCKISWYFVSYSVSELFSCAGHFLQGSVGRLWISLPYICFDYYRLRQIVGISSNTLKRVQSLSYDSLCNNRNNWTKSLQCTRIMPDPVRCRKQQADSGPVLVHCGMFTGKYMADLVGVLLGVRSHLIHVA